MTRDLEFGLIDRQALHVGTAGLSIGLSHRAQRGFIRGFHLQQPKVIERKS